MIVNPHILVRPKLMFAIGFAIGVVIGFLMTQASEIVKD